MSRVEYQAYGRRRAATVGACVLALLCLAWPLAAGGQRVPTDTGRAIAPRAIAPRVTPTVTAREWMTLGVFAIGTAAVAPFDSHLAHEMERPSIHRNRALVHTAAGFRAAGDPGALLVSVGAYALGRVTGHAGAADGGLHATEAVLLSGATTAILKSVVGRARPYIVKNDDPHVFRPLRPTAGYASFPSGHTTVAFAAASAWQAEFTRSDWAHSPFVRDHPWVGRAVAPMLFGSAALVGVSRMYHDAHWGSDVVAGAGIGTVVGAIVVRRAHAGTAGRIDRWLLPSLAWSSAEDGVVVGWKRGF